MRLIFWSPDLRLSSDFGSPLFRFYLAQSVASFCCKTQIYLARSPCTRRVNVSLHGIEARGFIFGPPIALSIGAKFVPLRKPRKLPEALARYDVFY
ncbi:Adenine phosphoribosyltransferase 2 [Camellia lanceoleosa]|uniref:Adenine phosphoribosyltransferase 2 n=1 Tax=Camellia lanceoleosa TaxID=1840588 RepID=A0ACC0G1A2_9ERIC|nr:Adenine phosphoribosyltransferase 2 [Camellia lanceoleosa]